jgi:hypothetical protein
MSKTIILLLALLLLGCSKELPKLDCSSSCDDEKIKAWYQKRYGEPITDFELSAKEVDYWLGGDWPGSRFVRRLGRYPSDTGDARGRNFILTKTATGAATGYIRGLDADIIDMEEWLDFIRSLSKLRVNEWKEFTPDNATPLKYRIKMQEDRSFSITFSDTSFKSSVMDSYPADLDELEKVMEGIKAKTEEKIAVKKEEAEAKLSMEYQKRYGEPITDFELSLTFLEFNFYKTTDFRNAKILSGYISVISDVAYKVKAARNIDKTSANIVFRLRKDAKSPASIFKTELNAEEWLDFVRALHESRFYEWEERYEGKAMRDDIHWHLETNNGVPQKSFEYTIFNSMGVNAYPENWGGFEKALDGIKAKIREKALIEKKEAEAKLSAEYQKRFGEPISALELSTTRIEADFSIPEINEAIAYGIFAYRGMNETNAGIHSMKYGSIDLSMEEWLDFVRALHKSRFYEWKESYVSKNTQNTPAWGLRVTHEDNEALGEYKHIKSIGTNAYPPNWAEFKKIMDEMEKKIKEKHGENH